MKTGKKLSRLQRVEIIVKMSFQPKRGKKQAEPTTGRPRGRPGDTGKVALNWLREHLKSGPKYSGNKNKPEPGTVFGDGLASGFSCNTVWRAADELGVVKHKDDKTRRWL